MMWFDEEKCAFNFIRFSLGRQ